MSRALAIVSLRFKLVTRKVRGRGRVANLIGAVLLGLLGGFFALALATGLGLMVHLLVAGDELPKIRVGFMVVCYVASVFGLVLPVLRGSMDQGFDVAPLIGFPIDRRQLYLITLAACFGGIDHLLYYPSLVAVGITGVALAGVDPLSGAALIALFLVFLVVASNAVALFAVSVMRARRVREIVGVVGLLLIISVSFLPMLMDSSQEALRESVPRFVGFLRTVVELARILPPSIAAEGLTALHDPDGGSTVWVSLAGLVVWTAAAAWVGFLIFDRYHLAERGVKLAASGKRRGEGLAGRVLSLDSRPFAALPPEVRAVAAKDLHYLFRSVLGRFNLFVVPAFVFLIVFGLGRAIEEPVLGIQPDRVLLYGLVFYTVLFSNNFVNNSFAWDGDGVKSYFLAPVTLERVLLGKNLALWLYEGLLLAIVLATWSVIMGPPAPLPGLSVILLFATAMLIFTSVGNVLSVLFPVPRDMSAIGNQPAQAAVLVGLVGFVGVGVMCGLALSVPLLLGWPAGQPLFLAVLLAAAAGVYLLALKQAAALFDHRREKIIDAMKAVR